VLTETSKSPFSSMAEILAARIEEARVELLRWARALSNTTDQLMADIREGAVSPDELPQCWRVFHRGFEFAAEMRCLARKMAGMEL